MRPKSTINKSWTFISGISSATFLSSGHFFGENGRKTVKKRVQIFRFMFVNKNELLTLILPSDSNSRDTRARGSTALPARGAEVRNAFRKESSFLFHLSKKNVFLIKKNQM